MRTEELQKEISALNEALSYVPNKTKFGDDNIEGIEAQILVLEKHMSENEVYEMSMSEEDEDHDNDDSKWCLRTRELALVAVRWREGQSAESPSSGWAAFKPKPTKQTKAKKGASR